MEYTTLAVIVPSLAQPLTCFQLIFSFSPSIMEITHSLSTIVAYFGFQKHKQQLKQIDQEKK